MSKNVFVFKKCPSPNLTVNCPDFFFVNRSGQDFLYQILSPLFQCVSIQHNSILKRKTVLIGGGGATKKGQYFHDVL